MEKTEMEEKQTETEEPMTEGSEATATAEAEPGTPSEGVVAEASESAVEAPAGVPPQAEAEEGTAGGAPPGGRAGREGRRGGGRGERGERGGGERGERGGDRGGGGGSGGGGGGPRQKRYDRAELEDMKLSELQPLATEMGVAGIAKMKKHDLIMAILKQRAEGEGLLFRRGVLDVLSEGYGFLRTGGFLPADGDIYVSMSQIRRFDLRRGDDIAGQVRPPKDNEKYYALLRIEAVNGEDPESARRRKHFEQLTPIYPDERYRLETVPQELAPRIIDLIAPIGKGQRGLIVSPPKAGKTTILKQFANSITTNNPEAVLLVLLVDERPEEVTDMERSVKGTVVSSTFDQPSDNHIQVAELILERAKRLVEHGKDVVVLLDSITRLARAYNLSAPASGRILSGGVDSTALYPPKRFFGAARNIEGGGSLTILATALVDTGSRMDEVIFEEFKGTGNMELHLDRKLADKRVFPAIDVERSGTRKEELILDPDEAELIWKLRRVLHALDPAAAIELLIGKIKETRSNRLFLSQIQKTPVQD